VGEPIRNARVQEALDVWATTKDTRTFSDVLRRAVCGELLLDISTSEIADRARFPQVGDRMAIASQTDSAGKRVLLAYTDNDRLAAHTPVTPMSLGQPAHAVLEQAMREYEGLVIDAGHPGMFIAYADEIRRGLGDEPAAAARLARDLVQRDRPFEQFLTGLALAPLYIPVETHRDEAGAVTGISVLTARDEDGTTLSAAFTSPAEVWAWAPEAEARPTRLQNLARVALQDGHGGVIVNAAGPATVLAPPLLAQYTGDAPVPPPAAG
jgi:hypothetical protein